MTSISTVARKLLIKYGHIQATDNTDEINPIWTIDLVCEMVAANDTTLNQFVNTYLWKEFEFHLTPEMKRIKFDNAKVWLVKMSLYRSIFMYASRQNDRWTTENHITLKHNVIDTMRENTVQQEQVYRTATSMMNDIPEGLNTIAQDFLLKVKKLNEAVHFDNEMDVDLEEGSIDNHCHLAAMSTRLELLNLIRTKANNGLKLNGRPLIEALKLTSIEQLNDKNLGIKEKTKTMFQHFERFEASLNIFNSPDLRKLFMKLPSQEYADLSKVVLSRYKKENIVAQARIPYPSNSEVGLLTICRWMVSNNLHRFGSTFFIQFNRSNPYTPEYIANCVSAIWKVISWDRSTDFKLDGNTVTDQDLFFLNEGLLSIGGFDLVGNEQTAPAPELYDKLFAATVLLNGRMKETRTPLSFIPHAGEFPNQTSMSRAFLTAAEIGHGIFFPNSVLRLLILLHQIPLHQCLKSNNKLTVKIDEHPIVELLKEGFVVTVNSDDTLVFQKTNNPIKEELTFLTLNKIVPDAEMFQLKACTKSIQLYFKSAIYSEKKRLRTTALAHELETMIPQNI